jgi:putative addiction module CopG family antidote
MSVTLAPQTEAEIERLVDSGRFTDADAVVQTALQVLNEQYETKLAKLRELVLAGFNSGPGEELTDELWDRLEREAEDRFQRGEQPSPHVCP